MKKICLKNLYLLLIGLICVSITILNSSVISLATSADLEPTIDNRAAFESYLANDYEFTQKNRSLIFDVIVENIILENTKKNGSYGKYRKILSILNAFPRNLDDVYTKKLAYTIVTESQKYGFDPLYVLALIRIESTFNYQARSPKGAVGLMQILPYVAKSIAKKLNIKWEGAKTLENPLLNVKIGVYFLKQLEKRYKLKRNHALVAYNVGPSKLKQIMSSSNRVPSKYSSKVLSKYRQYTSSY